MKVLVVDEELPFPLNTGKRIRTYNLLGRMQERHEITFLCHETSTAAVPGFTRINPVVVESPVRAQEGARFYAELGANLASTLPYVVTRHTGQAMRHAVSRLLDAERFDLLHCEWTPYTQNLAPRLGRLPSVLSAHNVEAQIWERYFRHEANPVRKAFIWLQWKKMLAFERSAARKYDTVVAVSAEDRRIFEEDYGARQVRVVANGVDERLFVPEPAAAQPDSMVFVGSLDWRPNQDAVTYFLAEIFPLVRRERANATVTFVGRKPPRWLVDSVRAVPGARIVPDAEDVRPHIAAATLYVVPLRIGGGSRLKILEALAMEKIVLSTPVGAEGLELCPGRDLVLAGDPAGFARTALEILREPGPWRRLALAGREAVLAGFTWDALARVLGHIWEETVESHGQAADRRPPA